MDGSSHRAYRAHMESDGALLRRASLTARLTEGVARKVTTIVAGAGCEKSTLLRAWVRDRRSAW